MVRALRGPLPKSARRSQLGQSMIEYCVVVSFGVLTLSSVPANARLGGLMVASLLACLAASLVLVPALARTREP